MKLLHITDLHFNQSTFEWVWKQRQGYDAICITGDFLSSKLEDKISKREQAEWVSHWLETFDKPLFICSGNHDLVPEPEQSIEELFGGYDDDGDYSEHYADFDNGVNNSEFSWLKSLTNRNIFSDNSKTSFMGFKIGCVPYYNTDLSYFYDCDIILYHVPPAHTDQSTSNDINYGCNTLRLYIDKNLLSAKYILSGHIHKPVATKSQTNGIWIINPGAGKSLIPKHEILVF